MNKKICFLVNYNLYESKRDFTQKLAAALNRQGVETLIIDLAENALEAEIGLDIHQFAPDYTCSFNTISPLPSGKFLWDVLKIPHLSILVDPAIYSLNLVKSPFSKISCVDHFDCQTIQEQGFDQVFFLPHAANPPQTINTGERPYDVVFIGSCYDFETFETSWETKYSPSIRKALKEAAALLFSEESIPLLHALKQALNQNRLDADQLLLQELFYELDQYTRGVDRIHLIRSIKDTSVQVYGDLMTDDKRHQKDWRYYLSDQPNVTVHAGISFTTALEILELSKICLNSMPFFKNGSHERIFNSFAHGALPISSRSLYLEDCFVEGQEIAFYSSNNRKQINAILDHYLIHEKERSRAVEAGREKVKKFHSWDARAKTLIEQLNRF